ncbi:ATP-binding protein [Clostridium sporogenes]|uniref:histidine kinase n=2 Tax=Clostridium sporogenes TaxID=1509 RepID=A0AAE4FLT3_CLOSG|nr:ATP-binding protein [Clostridium sporogenes]
MLTVKNREIKKEHLPFVFERLYRADKSRQKFKGSSIGLTIVKNILHLHETSIDIESEEDEGTTFRDEFHKNINN